MAENDAVKADPKHYKVEFENQQVRVLRVNYGARETSVMHSHPGTVIIFLNECHGRFTFPDGKTEDIRGSAGQVAWSDATTHRPENLGDTPLDVLLVELKG